MLQLARRGFRQALDSPVLNFKIKEQDKPGRTAGQMPQALQRRFIGFKEANKPVG